MLYSRPVNALAIDVEQLISLCEQDHSVGYHFMKQVGIVLEWRFLDTALQAADLLCGLVLSDAPSPPRR